MYDIALMAAGAFITSQGISSRERAEVASARCCSNRIIKR